MPFQTTKVDVTSPLLQYTLNTHWALGNQNSDAATVLFDQGTFMATGFNNSLATFNFTGNQVNIVGSYRSAHGPYLIHFDGNTSGPYRIDPTQAPPTDKPLIGQTLFSWQGEEGSHSVAIENYQIDGQTNPNQPDPHNPGQFVQIKFIDVDFVNWTSSVASTSDLKIDDTDGRFIYDQNWNADVSSLPEFDQQTGHVTNHPGALVSLSFNGDRIAIYGTTGVNGTLYNVQLDQGPVQSMNGSLPADIPGKNQIMYAANGLSSGSHTLKMTANPSMFNQGLPPGNVLGIDYAIVDATVNKSDASRHGLAPGAIAGVVIAILVWLGLLAGGVLLYLRRRRRRAIMVQSVTPHPSMLNSEMSFMSKHTTYLPSFIDIRAPAREVKDVKSHVGQTSMSSIAKGPKASGAVASYGAREEPPPSYSRMFV